MSAIDDICKSMREDQIYDEHILAEMTHFHLSTVRSAIKLLSKAGFLEIISIGKVKRKKVTKIKPRQKNLF